MRNFNENPSEEHLNVIRFILDPESTDADIDLLNKNYESPHNMNRELISAIVAEQHEIRHNKSLEDHAARLQKLKKLEEDYEF